MPYFGIPIRNGLPIGLGSVAGFGVQQFSPADLFSAGEQGAWYDPSDFSTLFDDSAGTTPVSAPGNGADVWVGLMLDKSKGLVLGPELVTNGDFSSGTTGWSVVAPATMTLSSGSLSVSRNGAAFVEQAAFDISVVAGKTYRLTCSVTSGPTNANAEIAIISSDRSTQLTPVAAFRRTTVGALSGVYVAASTATVKVLIGIGGDTTGTTAFDNISVRELPGNHAYQTASAKRPKLAARYNLLTYTEQFDNNTAWTKTNTTAANTTDTTDPLGGLTADKLVAAASSGVSHSVGRAAWPLPSSVGVVIASTFVIYAKAAEYSFINISFQTGEFGSANYASINLSTGAVTGSGGSGLVGTPTIALQNNGWYRITVNGSSNDNRYTSGNIFIAGTPTALNSYNPSFTGDGTSGVYIWGADLRPTSQATGLIGPTYQRVVDAATYDTVGFLPYLEFNGLSWSMSTGSIDFTATDKMTVWAGYRISAGTGSQQLAELTANGYTTNGGFAVGQGPNAGTSGFGFLMNNGAGIAGETAAITVPYSSVISYQFDSALSGLANEAKLRRNQVAQTYASTTGTDSGTGNFANAPLYLGARLGTSVYINGWLTSLIVRGAQSTQGQIEATEAWVNSRTGAY
jgi:hypothetical protein